MRQRKHFSNPTGDIEIKIIGLRPGEKIHEDLITSSESNNTIDAGKYYVILAAREHEFINKYKNVSVGMRVVYLTISQFCKSLTFGVVIRIKE